MTGQPDFAHFVIDYVPRAWLIEFKVLKFYLGSFRNHSAFHEQCTVTIGKRLASTYEPEFLRISGYWYPRGGMPIDVFWQFFGAGNRAVALSANGIQTAASTPGVLLLTKPYRKSQLANMIRRALTGGDT